MSRGKYLKYIGEKQRFLTIDPGCRKNEGTGLASWKNQKLEFTEQFNGDLSSWEQNIDYILVNFSNIISELDANYIPAFIERPQFMDTYKGDVAARSDSLFKLCCLYGRLWQCLIHHSFSPVSLRIIDWKGTMPKRIVKKRIEKVTGKKFPSDVTDAVGMGLYLLGKL